VILRQDLERKEEEELNLRQSVQEARVWRLDAHIPVFSSPTFQVFVL